MTRNRQDEDLRPPSLSDRSADWADRIRARDPEAVREVFRQYHGLVFRSLRSGVRSRELAEELTARVFFRLVDTAAGFRGSGEVIPAYLLGIARHVLQEHHRDTRHWVSLGELTAARHLDRGDGSSGLPRKDRGSAPRLAQEAVSGARPGPDRIHELEEEWDRVRRLIAGLGPVEQQVVHLRFVEGWSLDRVAEAIGIPVGTVKSHVHRVRRRLRDLSPREGVAET